MTLSHFFHPKLTKSSSFPFLPTISTIHQQLLATQAFSEESPCSGNLSPLQSNQHPSFLQFLHLHNPRLDNVGLLS